MSRVRLDLRLVAAGALALIAGLTVLSLTRPAARVEVLVAAEALPAGVPLDTFAFTKTSVEPIAGLVLADQAPELVGWTLAVDLSEGAPLTDSILEPPPGAEPHLIAVTLEMGHAVQGQLIAGDLVDIYVTDDLETRLLAASVKVISAEVDTVGLVGSDVALLLAVDDALAPRLVAAMQTAAIDLVRVTE
ncbi:MAG: SAF domain-containing protein [Acidimicrobiia bacterium]